MGNQATSPASRHESVSSSFEGMCPRRQNSWEKPKRRIHSSHSSTDSEPNNNGYAKMSCESDVLTVAARKAAPMKQRKISRAASAGRIRTRRQIPGLGSFGSKGDVLDDQQKEAVVESWSALQCQIPCQTAVGLGIYQRIFEQAPELKSVFQVPDTAPKDLPGYVPFHRSAKLFTSVIDLCVRSIHTIESDMGPVLVMYGRRHFHREGQGFRTEYLPLFAQIIAEYVLDNIPEEEKSDESVEGWRLLLKYLTGKMAEGVELERMRNADLRRKSLL